MTCPKCGYAMQPFAHRCWWCPECGVTRKREEWSGVVWRDVMTPGLTLPRAAKYGAVTPRAEVD